MSYTFDVGAMEAESDADDLASPATGCWDHEFDAVLWQSEDVEYFFGAPETADVPAFADSSSSSTSSSDSDSDGSGLPGLESISDSDSDTDPPAEESKDGGQGPGSAEVYYVMWLMRVSLPTLIVC